jgi:hypothetical protein
MGRLTGVQKTLWILTGTLLTLALARHLASAGQAPAATTQIGIAFPSIQRLKYYTATNLTDIRDGLHGDFLRTGWIPDTMKFDKVPWQREDRGMHRLCSRDLNAMIITPSPKDDAKGEEHLYRNIEDFFERYTAREPGCITYAEIGNEADLPKNGFPDVYAYARYYERVAPMAAKYGIKVITAGTSGKDAPWTYTLALLLRKSGAPLNGFGFHPYGVPPRLMGEALLEMQRAAAGGTNHIRDVYVTELGVKNPDDLREAIASLAHLTPALVIFEYVAQGREDSGFGLTDDPRLYRAAQDALVLLHDGDNTR